MKLQILFADDSKMFRFYVSEMLKSAGHTVDVVTDGDEIFEQIRSGLRPDVIVTDNNMDRVDGIEVLRRIRDDDEFNYIKNLPIVVFSSDSRIGSVKNFVTRLGGTFVDKKGDNLLAAVDAIAAVIAKERG